MDISKHATPQHQELSRRFRAVSLLLLVACSSCAATTQVVQLVVQGDDHSLRQRPLGGPENSPGRPAILFLALDGVDRPLLYDMLRAGELPMLAALLGGEHGAFPHAVFEDSLLSTLPSTTMPAWATAMTGVGPAHHGISGNEFFIREERRMATPAPTSFSAAAPTLAIYTDGYVNALLRVPSVYERMRKVDPNILIWVAMHQVFSGADRLLVVKPLILAEAFGQLVEDAAEIIVGGAKPARRLFERVDKEVVEVVVSALEKGPIPDVLTVYLVGTDLYAHIADEGPERARRDYLRDVVDPSLGALLASLRARGALTNRYVVLTSDHGHTEVLHDQKHAFSTEADRGPRQLLATAGFRLRPFASEVDASDDFDAVLAYGGATAYAYVADRSTCPRPHDVCDWKKPPRFAEDVVPLAEAFFNANKNGQGAPELEGTLDLILTRRPKSFRDVDLPFEVYIGAGKTMPVGDYLAGHPHPTYVAVESRLRDLAVGPLGERAGDIMLVAHNGDKQTPEERHYFASPYRSWHGSPSRKDSEIPLIVAHPGHRTAELRRRVARAIGPAPTQQKITDLLLELRASGD